jgi:S1-C subfamily serine protease
VQVSRAYDPEKYMAYIEIVGHECDLAILRVKDKAFFEGLKPLSLGTLPKLRDDVAVYGFPTGGDKISITEGVVSRIEIQPYAHSDRNLLAVQIDAAINPGNSGGPVIQKGKIIGIAFQTNTEGENIGYMVPVPIIEHFLTDIEDGKYDGFPILRSNLAKS